MKNNEKKNLSFFFVLHIETVQNFHLSNRKQFGVKIFEVGLPDFHFWVDYNEISIIFLAILGSF